MIPPAPVWPRNPMTCSGRERILRGRLEAQLSSLPTLPVALRTPAMLHGRYNGRLLVAFSWQIRYLTDQLGDLVDVAIQIMAVEEAALAVD
ncbi:hypothetical protein OPV22_030878 [Ensete ventricosum]|uniref:Uncharacterized protein n=1 Tax=Ensete ventricosum TaxID=4639 RepID=A0AAV8PK29_ENSVE|nr:hypothetical protein OPV22_030878 [Ensete ventricosum]